MTRLAAVTMTLLSLFTASYASAADEWKEGTNYFMVTPAQRTNVAPGKVEVLEVFSYGCPACNQFTPVMKKLVAALPANAQVAYLPAAFNTSEGWPMFQRAYFAAQALGVADRAHDAMYESVWRQGELSITDSRGQLKRPLPSIEDAAKFYAAKTGVKPEAFLAAAKSFSVEGKIKAADKQIVAMHVDRTPTIVVAGKYRLHAESAGGYDQLIQLTKWLIAKESGAAR
jgi:thiol:disulfide interchange protein DsbA